MKRFLFWSAVAILIAIGLFLSLRPQPVGVDAIAIERGDLIVMIEDEGQTRVHDIYVLSAPVMGRMRRIDAHVGDAVIALETIVAEIEPTDPAFLDPRNEAQARADVQAAGSAAAVAQAEVDQAQAELEFSDHEFNRARQLIRQAMISQREFDMAERSYRTRRAALATALAALEMRKFQLDRARAQLLSPAETQANTDICACIELRAPHDGQILRLLHQSEAVVAAGAALAEIGDARDLEIVVDLLSADAVRVEAGQRVIIDRWGGPTPLEGRVRLVEPFGFTKISALGIEEQRVNVIIDITSPREAWLRLAHGYQVDAGIVLTHLRDVLKVPLTALFRVGPDWAVFIIRDERAVLQRVTIGQRNYVEAEVLTGLEDNDQVVLHPSDRVVDGVRTAIR